PEQILLPMPLTLDCNPLLYRRLIRFQTVLLAPITPSSVLSISPWVAIAESGGHKKLYEIFSSIFI
ncbi:MAG: hypothetical protein LBT03_02845, partial [Holosporales bacterium]|nr:hypothetical protein [Holosporales bacterium]